MTDELFPTEPMSFASTRHEALQQLEAFIPRSGRYGRDRNHVLPGHTNVSRLSPAIRHRLILESECAEAPRTRYAASTVEKFTQEVYWRRYWKNWLSLRPQVWTDYLDQLDTARTDRESVARASRCEAGESDIAIMNHFARELVETGYLHNHARMWFAGWWVHIEQLPWQLGADFFFRHLLDGDPASNTLSWRWVAGLQTPGKTYLPRRSNLEKYLPEDMLAEHAEGLDRLEKPVALRPDSVEKVEITHPMLEPDEARSTERLGLWVHEEDLLPESGPLASLRPQAILATGHSTAWKSFHFPTRKTDWLKQAIHDGATRAEAAFGLSATVDTEQPLTSSMVTWAKAHQLEHIIALRPDIGPLHDLVPELRRALGAADITLQLIDRPEDLALRPLAIGGFFGFWKKMQRSLAER